MKRPLDRGLLAAVKRELAFIIPVDATKLACEVTVTPRSASSRYTDARAHVQWRTADGQVLEVKLVGSDDSDVDPGNIALAYLLGRAEKVKTGAGRPVTGAATENTKKKTRAKDENPNQVPAKKAKMRDAKRKTKTA